MPFPNARADLGFFAALWPCQFPTKGNFRRRNEFIPSESVRRMNQASSVLNLERSLGLAAIILISSEYPKSRTSRSGEGNCRR
jgi:hypothetical protein